MARSGRRRSFFREAGNLSLRRATTRCTCICSCTVLESYPSVRGSPILALTCVNAEPTLLSRSDTPPDLAFFAPYASLRGVESCSSSSPPAGRPASRYSVLDGRLRDGRPGGTRTGLSSEVWREFPALAVAVLSSLARDSGVSGEDLHYRARTDYPRVFRTSRTTKKPKAGGPPGISWPTGGTERHETTDGPPSPPPGRRRSVYDTTVLRPFGARDSYSITERDPRPEKPGTGASASGTVPSVGQP
jgi:hypothetical protein